MRIHALENVQRAIDFLHEKRVPLENIGNHDVVDGNHRIILGLIWTVILRFQIQDIIIDTEDSKERRSAKDALLLWCQMKTRGYPGVEVRNFHGPSWANGLAFNAIIHKHCPHMVDFDKLAKGGSFDENTANLNNAFTAAEQLGIAPLLDAEDLTVDQPDEKSIITYVVSYYHYFNELAKKGIGSNRIGTILDSAIGVEDNINKYNEKVAALLEWIRAKVDEMSRTEFENSLDGVQKQLSAFNNYRQVEKPPKFDEKGSIEVLRFTIQSQMRADNRQPWTPTISIAVIQAEWDGLETTEHKRELAIHEELKRQERLNALVENFLKKAKMREDWLRESAKLLASEDFGADLAAVEAAQKKHEAIEMDILAYSERIKSLVQKCQILEDESYHDIGSITSRWVRIWVISTVVNKHWSWFLNPNHIRHNIEESKQLPIT